MIIVKNPSFKLVVKNFFCDVLRMFRDFLVFGVTVIIFLGIWILSMPFHHIGLGPLSEISVWLFKF